MKESLKIKERVIELHKLINFHSYNYHSLDSPSIEDHEYDALFNELLNLEAEYPRYKYSYSCLLYTSPSPRDGLLSRMPSSA